MGFLLVEGPGAPSPSSSENGLVLRLWWPRDLVLQPKGVQWLGGWAPWGTQNQEGGEPGPQPREALAPSLAPPFGPTQLGRVTPNSLGEASTPCGWARVTGTVTSGVTSFWARAQLQELSCIILCPP